MVDIYIALSYVQYMLNVLHTLLAQKACVVLHIYTLSQSLCWNIQPQYLRIIHAQGTITHMTSSTHLMPGTQFMT